MERKGFFGGKKKRCSIAALGAELIVSELWIWGLVMGAIYFLMGLEGGCVRREGGDMLCIIYESEVEE